MSCPCVVPVGRESFDSVTIQLCCHRANVPSFALFLCFCAAPRVDASNWALLSFQQQSQQPCTVRIEDVDETISGTCMADRH